MAHTSSRRNGVRSHPKRLRSALSRDFSPMPLRRRRGEDDVTETRVPQTADEEVVEEQVPPPSPPRIWPWLLLLLLLVVGGLVAYFLLTRGDDKTTMPNVVGLREDQARARLAEAQLEADVDRRPSRRPRG